MYRYLVIEYCFEDEEWQGSRRIVGSYESNGAARKAAGEYIRRNVKKKKAKYRHWQVDVQRELVYFPIRDV